MVDDLFKIGTSTDTYKMATQIKSKFDCDDLGKIKEYVGWKIDINSENRSMRITQPVLLQSFKDEFDLASMDPVTPIKVHCSGVGKLLPKTRWSRSEIQNSMHELSRQCKIAPAAHILSYVKGYEVLHSYTKPWMVSKAKQDLGWKQGL